MTSHIVFVKDGKLIEEDISKYQEDVYYIKVRDAKNTLNKLNDPEFRIKADEIVVSTTKYRLSEIIGKINEVDEIIDIRREIMGAERRYEELYKN
jgi:ABC-2 type transport system ATP-binding protein